MRKRAAEERRGEKSDDRDEIWGLGCTSKTAAEERGGNNVFELGENN